ncbi:hypothetical protein DDZ15_16320 [Rhodohalobacter mucosus]|uniref:Uncharacterized protein n=1 Tax=Rhodohalobacter mucosus TaxID=2079485 RepID=A0A316TMW7_9BACT|nr:hypothetical protein DDZ15_16320 [Rhodohalobacter mucosus]
MHDYTCILRFAMLKVNLSSPHLLVKKSSLYRFKELINQPQRPRRRRCARGDDRRSVSSIQLSAISFFL